MKPYILTLGLALLMAAPPVSAEAAPRMKAKPAVWTAGDNAQVVQVHRRGFRRGWRGGFRGGFRFGPRRHWHGPRWGFRYGPRWRSGFWWGFSAPLVVPRYVPPPTPAPYILDGVPYARSSDHCTSILNYAEQRKVPPGWSVEGFNTEVQHCRESRYPTAPPGTGTVTPGPAMSLGSHNASVLSDDLACRDLAFRATQGGPGPDKVVEGGFTGGLLGAAAGAAIGAIAGDPGAGAAIGAAAGGIGGAVVNNEQAGQDFYEIHRNCMANRGH